MDGVIADFHGTLLDKYNAQYKTSFTLDQCTTFEFSECLGVEVWDQMEQIYNAPGFFSEIRTIPGSDRLVSNLIEIAEVEICSAPTKLRDSNGHKKFINADCAARKILWIHDNFPSLSSNITLAINKHRYKADILVDDALHNHAQWCKAHPGSIGILIDRPWNQTKKLPKNCIRSTIDEVPDIVKERFPAST